MGSRKSNKAAAGGPNHTVLVAVAAVMAGLAAGALIFGGGGSGDKPAASQEPDRALGALFEPEADHGVPDTPVQALPVISEGGALEIDPEAVSAAMFYGVDVDGVTMGVWAVRGSDDEIRTAYDACRDCYTSGRGYYEWNGNGLTCQNCGQRFGLDEIGIDLDADAGCNPWPILDGDRTIGDDGIIRIPYESLAAASALFAMWQ